MSARVRVLQLGLLAISVLLALALGEGLVRLVAPQQLIIERPDVWYPLEGPGWKKRPDVDTDINSGEGTVRLRTDASGFRVGPEGRVDTPRNVLLLGDSFMEAIQVEHAESLAGRLELGLSDALGETVSVWNTAVSGWGPSHYLFQARELLETRRFDLVLVALYLGNDAETTRVDRFPPRDFVERHPLRWPREASWEEFVASVLRPLNDALERRSHLFLLLKHRQHTLLMRLGLTGRYVPFELLASPAVERAWRGTASTVRAIVDLAHAAGTPTRIVMLPSHYQVDARALAGYRAGMDLEGADLDIERPNRQLARALAGQQLEAIDATPALRSAFGTGEPVYGQIDTHLNARGHAVVADRLLPELTPAIRRSPR